MAIGVAFRSGIRAGAQNKNPTGSNPLRQSTTKCLDWDWLPSHYRLAVMCKLSTHPIDDGLNLAFVRSDDLIK